MDSFTIVEFSTQYKEDVKALLRELQEYIVELDPYKLNVLKDGYEDKCFEIDYSEVIKNNGIIYLALENNIVVGLIMGVIRKPVIEYDYERKYNMGEITELIVRKNVRSKGVGKKLIDKMELYFKEKNCNTVNIDVFGYNEVGKKFYFKNGYQTRMMTVSKKIK